MQNVNTSTLTCTLRRVWPDGGAAYVVEGLDGTLYLKRGLLSGEPPATLTLSGVGLADPGVVAAERKAKAEAKAAAAAVSQPEARVPQPASRAPQPEAAKPAAPAKAARKSKAA